MWWRVALVLWTCSCCMQSPDPVMWLDWHGFKVTYLEEVSMPTVGPGMCPSGYRGWVAQATRKPMPEDSPCILISSRVRVCCPNGRRGKCHGSEIEKRCASYEEVPAGNPAGDEDDPAQRASPFPR